MNAAGFALAHQRRGRADRGFTMFELLIAVSVIAVLGVVMLNRVFFYQELAEKQAMENTASIIKAALQYRMAELMSANREEEIRALATENPMRWLERTPSNYLGERREPAEPGNWYFDPGTRHLNYVVEKDSYLKLDQPAPKRIEYQVRVRYEQVEMYGARNNVLVGVALIPITHYKWL